MEHEQENALLRKRIIELEERLAKQQPVGKVGNHHSNGSGNGSGNGSSNGSSNGSGNGSGNGSSNGSGIGSGNGAMESDVAIDSRLLGAAMSSLSDGVIICNNEGKLLYLNAAAEAIFGKGVTDAAPAEWSTQYGVFYEEGGALVQANDMPLVRAISGEEIDNVEFFIRTETRPKGASIQCSARPIYDDQRKLVGAVVTCRDISERKQIETERLHRLHAEEQRLVVEKQSLRMAKMFEALLDNLDLVVWSIDEKGTFTFHDGRGTVGMPKFSHVGKSIFDLYEDTVALRRALEGLPQHEINVTNDIAWETWYVPVREQESERWNVIGLSLNVTEAHQAKMNLEAKLALIERQQAVINDLETPIIQVWDRILTLPMVGVVDSRRAARVTDDLLNQVSRTQARFAILDLTGVEVVDTATAGHMLNIIAAVRLLGAEGIITGIRPNIAQTMISLGVDLSRVRTLATLRDGLAFAIKNSPKAKVTESIGSSDF